MTRKIEIDDRVRTRSPISTFFFDVPKDTDGYITEIISKETEDEWALVSVSFPGLGTANLYGYEFRTFRGEEKKKPRNITVKGKNLRLGDVAEWYGLPSAADIVKLEYSRYDEGVRTLITVTLMNDREEVYEIQVAPGEKLEVKR